MWEPDRIQLPPVKGEMFVNVYDIPPWAALILVTVLVAIFAVLLLILLELRRTPRAKGPGGFTIDQAEPQPERDHHYR